MTIKQLQFETYLSLVLITVTSLPSVSLVVDLSSELPSGRRTKLLELYEEEL